MESKTKQDHPPNAATSMLIDHLNAKALMALFNRAKDNDEEDECERLCHAITLHLRMHNQVRCGAARCWLACAGQAPPSTLLALS